MKPVPTTFAARLRRLRTEAGLSIPELAARSGLSRQQIHQLEQRQQPSLAMAQRVAQGLGLTLAAFEGCAHVDS